MNKIICLTIIAMFALSILPISFAKDVQTADPMKVTEEIDPETAPLFSDLTNTAFAQSYEGNADDQIIAHGRPAPQPKSYALFIEIDYMTGHKPTDDVLNYMTNYYLQRGIQVNIKVDQEVPVDNSVSDDDFWALEAQYNQGPDTANSNPTFQLVTLPQKWVLYGTTVENEANVVGYTLCWGTSRDLVAGNWIYIADKTGDDLTTNTDMQAGIEAVVLMHEFGHSIGICTVRAGSEAYCSNYYCVMSYVRTQNAGNFDQWYYCSNHWKTKNLDYYVV